MAAREQINWEETTGPRLYSRARQRIPGGTGLLSKRPEMFLPGLWPSYYSKAVGCEVWDLDEAGGIWRIHTVSATGRSWKVSSGLQCTTARPRVGYWNTSTSNLITITVGTVRYFTGVCWSGLDMNTVSTCRIATRRNAQ